MLEFHQAVVSTLRDADDAPVPLDPAPLPPIQPIQPNNPLLTHTSEDMARLCETHNDFGQDHEDEADTGKKKCEKRFEEKKKTKRCVDVSQIIFCFEQMELLRFDKCIYTLLTILQAQKKPIALNRKIFFVCFRNFVIIC